MSNMRRGKNLPSNWDDDMSDEDYLQELAGRLSEDDQYVKDVLERAKSVYVECGRDRVATNDFGEFVTDMMAKKGNRRDDGRLFIVTGESGAGKTTISQRIIAQHPVFKPLHRTFGTIYPSVFYSLMGPATLKFLGIAILEAIGYEITRNLEQGEVWHILPSQLHLRKVLLIHLDETQHLLNLTQTDHDREKLRKALKGVMNYQAWPVSFVMSGMPEITKIAQLDEQFERRHMPLPLPDVDPSHPEERDLVIRITKEMCEAAHIDPTQAIQSDIPERIAHAARYRYGRITQVVLAGIQQAARKRSTALTRNFLARAYAAHSHARGRPEMNIFLADDFMRLDPGLFLQVKED
ncbi:TniB family NTP-binding protein [Mesorhizobium sp.]|uniref:TniB family NTP-binding protein n=1 Tax=Mesorhizobium sp. TaxID=1871066 RepID=UPI0025EFA893|nr:TniB family NTP-binding protein [Mesorhizobium sp.]